MPLPWLWSVKSKTEPRVFSVCDVCVTDSRSSPQLWHCGSVETLTSVSQRVPKLNPWCRERSSSPVITGGEQDAGPVQIKLFLSPPPVTLTLTCCQIVSEYTSYMPSRRIPPTALFSFLLVLFGYIYIFKTLSFLSLFFFFFYRGVFSILLHSIAHNLTNVKCTAAWLVQPFKHEPGRYRPSFQQQQKNKHDMQLKRVVLFGGKISKLLTALHGSVSLCFGFFFFFLLPSNMQVVHFSAVWKAGTCEVSICLFETDDVSSKRYATWQTLPRMASQSDSPYYCTPLPAYPTWFLLLSQRTCVHRGGFFLFCIKVKSTIFGIVTRNQGTM